ncbi:FAD binding domain-containing protein [Pseudobacteriovorax antillogorgiicola]|uniref:Xanthine dehydrogenase YagS FAD-binding subunit n=1 Tax=Pseudobacteriovorax antillogorgiicola TaxID=1513793 RepID=A0A1Y6CAR7_9BACT|nr:xanthine dehydrogenase family protein subunit M [Pseudobacteriovorax antillogorgiicola]TCS48725.1 xanthine dehydrogenase YagS FAD-binding subunit [Pseudobacteriovorax antillogorgiicola]SMF54497.1 xanthine dehydrogenase YagS FAD-binding subunit [Pseudobacteriovorax antillogorgiicola]
MLPFEYVEADSFQSACSLIDHRSTMALGGGTTLIDLMKLNVLKPSSLVSIKPLLSNYIIKGKAHLKIGAACTMAQLAENGFVKNDFPALRQSLILAASPQIRNMATIAGNILQRSRSPYYRHPDFPDPNAGTKDPFELEVDASHLAILGHGDRLMGTYPGDLAVVLLAFDASVVLASDRETRVVALRDFLNIPQNGQNQYDVDLLPGELITEVLIPTHKRRSLFKRSIYYKVRERSSYAFALASAGIGLQLQGIGPKTSYIEDVHIALGGVAPIPWRAKDAETFLKGKRPSDEAFMAAAEIALRDARAPMGGDYKITLAKRTLVRALKIARDRGALSDDQVWELQHGRGSAGTTEEAKI